MHSTILDYEHTSTKTNTHTHSYMAWSKCWYPVGRYPTNFWLFTFICISMRRQFEFLFSVLWGIFDKIFPLLCVCFYFFAFIVYFLHLPSTSSDDVWGELTLDLLFWYLKNTISISVWMSLAKSLGKLQPTDRQTNRPTDIHTDASQQWQKQFIEVYTRHLGFSVMNVMDFVLGILSRLGFCERGGMKRYDCDDL